MTIKLPIAILGASTLLSLLAQAGQNLPTGIGDFANLSAVSALIWIVIKVLPKIHADYLKAFREERAADRASSERQQQLLVDSFSTTIKELSGK